MRRLHEPMRSCRCNAEDAPICHWETGKAEQIMAENPDVVFLVSYGDDEGQLAKIRSNPAFRNLNFIRDGRLYPIPLKFVYGPQTRTIDAIGYMANYMYPGLFDFVPEYDFGVQSLKE